ncbi:MAG TPA: hypothetical protein VHN14_28160 [Kofleriaceae bacterium]|jgi:hypothetical protein|nr:hypothetical protein [Kofleriaceae bacterium]
MKHISLITVGMFITACSSSSKPTPEQYDDTAQAIATATATGGSGGTSSSGGDVAAMADTVSLSLGVVPQGITVMGNGSFQGSHLGVNYSYSLTCKSVAGVVGVCGPTTDQATVSVAWSGNLTSTNLDASVNRTGNWTITGLGSDTATFAGDSSFMFDATVRSIFRPGATATYSFDASASYHAVRLSTQDHKVIDGSASFDVTAHSMVTGAGSNDSSASFDVHADITFKADHTATLVLDGSQHYSLNLDTGIVIRAN